MTDLKEKGIKATEQEKKEVGHLFRVIFRFINQRFGGKSAEEATSSMENQETEPANFDEGVRVTIEILKNLLNSTEILPLRFPELNQILNVSEKDGQTGWHEIMTGGIHLLPPVKSAQEFAIFALKVMSVSNFLALCKDDGSGLVIENYPHEIMVVYQKTESQDLGEGYLTANLYVSKNYLEKRIEENRKRADVCLESILRRLDLDEEIDVAALAMEIRDKLKIIGLNFFQSDVTAYLQDKLSEAGSWKEVYSFLREKPSN